MRLAKWMTGIAIVGCLSVLMAPFASARTITIDGNPADWLGEGVYMTAPATANLGQIGRNTSNEGEYIWKDATGDERTDFTTPTADTDHDLTAFRASGDADYFYFTATFGTMNATGGAGAAVLMLALRAIENDTGAQRYFPLNSNTQVAENAAWNYTIVYTAGDTTAKFTYTSWSSSPVGLCATSIENKSIECRISWQQMGIAPGDTPYSWFRTTLAVFRSDGAGGVVAVGDGSTSAALDVITNYGNVGSSGNTWAEVADGVIDYSFDLYFDTDGNIKPPLVITEVMYDSSDSADDGEFVEFYNNTNRTLDATSIKFGDAEVIDGTSEGMLMPPSGAPAIQAGETRVWAKNCGVFGSNPTTSGRLPNYTSAMGSCTDSSVLIAATYTNWFSSSVANGIALGNSADSVLVLDRADTVVDVISYKTATPAWNNITSATTVLATAGTSLRRKLATIDTNSMVADFLISATPTPGIAEVPETCNNKDDDGDGTTDNNIASVACTSTNPGICAAGHTACANGVQSCVSDIQPGTQTEVCDGLDNDCNGQEDELNTACDTGKPGVCAPGHDVCTPSNTVECVSDTPPSMEVCDGEDNDCDDAVDDDVVGYGNACTVPAAQGQCLEGYKDCLLGTLTCVSIQSPSDELCNNLDDDCDGNTDESPVDVGQGCDSGLPGACAQGTTVCASGTTMCDSLLPGMIEETCNGEDDDCNGYTDEADPRVNTPCTPDKSKALCGIYTYVCNTGTGTLTCELTGGVGPEVCDGKDNNCDGNTDEGFGLGAACSVGTGECAADGALMCDGEGGVMCSVAPLDPTDERCDGKDNDCDGSTDNGGDSLCTTGNTACVSFSCQGQSGCVSAPLSDWTACTIDRKIRAAACFVGVCETLFENDTCETAHALPTGESLSYGIQKSATPHLYWPGAKTCFTGLDEFNAVDLFYSVTLEAEKRYTLSGSFDGVGELGILLYGTCNDACNAAKTYTFEGNKDFSITISTPTSISQLVQVVLPSRESALQINFVEEVAPTDGDIDTTDGDSADGDTTEPTDGDLTETDTEATDTADGDTDQADGDTTEPTDGDLTESDTETTDTADGDTTDEDLNDNDTSEPVDGDETDADTTDNDTADTAADGDTTDDDSDALDTDTDATDNDTAINPEKKSSGGCRQTSTDAAGLFLLGLAGLALARRRQRD